MDLLLEEVPAAPPPRWLPWVVAASAVAVAVVSFSWWIFSRPVAAPLKPLMRLDVDLGAGLSQGAFGTEVAISPDGTRLVYVSNNKLFTRRLDQPKSIELQGTDGAFSPFFSPDGQWVAFFIVGRLRKISVAGGAAIDLCNANGRGGSWGDDDMIVASIANGGLSRIPSAGGAPAPLTQLGDGETNHRWPQVLPGGKAVLFTGGISNTYDAANIDIFSFGDNKTRVLLRGGTYGRYVTAANGAGYLTYVSRGTLFAVPFDLSTLTTHGSPSPVLEDVSYSAQQGFARLEVSQNGTAVYRSGEAGVADLSSVQWLDASGKTQPLLAKLGVYAYPKLSPDGQRLALSAASTLSVYDWQRDRLLSLTAAGGNQSPVWTPPDGRYILFKGASEGMFWTRSDGGGKAQPLLQSKNVQYPRSFTSDGKRLAFDELVSGTGYDLWTVSIENDAGGLRAGKPELFLQTPFEERYGVFSPDGRWLAYSSNESGTFQIYVKAFPDKNGGRWPVSEGPDGGVLPEFTRQGNELFFRALDNRLMTAKYTVKGDSIDFDKPRLWSEKRLASLGLVGSYSVSSDGKRVAAVLSAATPEAQATQNHVTFLLNFVDEIRRRLAAEGRTP